MTRRNLVWVALGLSLALFACLAVLDTRMTDTGGPGIIPFEVAATEERAAEILDEWGDDGQDAAKLSLWLDFLYLLAYGLLLFLLVQAARERLASWGGGGLASRFGPWIQSMPVVAAGADAVEDVFLLLTLGGHGGGLAPALAAIFALIKFAALLLTAAFLVAYLIRSFQNKRTPADTR